MADQWYFLQAGQQFGPLTGAQLKNLALTGQLQPTDLVWKTGMTTRVPARSVRGLCPQAGVAVANRPARAPAAAPMPVVRGIPLPDDEPVPAAYDEPRRPARGKQGGGKLWFWLLLGGGGLVLLGGAVLLLVLLGGGGKVTEANFALLRNGMTENEATAILGSPTRTMGGQTMGGFTTPRALFWEGGGNVIQATFLEGRLVNKGWIGGVGGGGGPGKIEMDLPGF